MDLIAYNLVRVSLLAALVLVPGAAPAGALAALQTTPAECLQVPILGKITGTVRDGEGRPLGGVEVRAYGTMSATPRVDDTNAAGEYGIPLPPGSYLLEFRPSDGPFQVAWYKSGSLPLDATPVEVGDGRTVSGIDVALPAGAQLNVTLRDSAGAAVPEGLISVFDSYGRKVAEGQTDDQGRALTGPGLPPGSYRLLARPAYGSPLLAQYHDQKPALDDADPIAVTQVGSLDIPMTLQRGAQLSGTVTDAATGAPLSGIAVDVLGTSGETRHATSDGQGRYSVEGLASGTYRVNFRSDLSRPSSRASLRRLVALSAPNTLGGFNAALTRGGTIVGRVTAPDGSPIPDAHVSVRDVDGAINHDAYTAADGTYAIQGLPSGHYRITYDHLNFQVLAPADPVAVSAPSTTALASTVLAPGGAITGKVTGPDGKPVEGVSISILDAATGTIQGGTSYTNAAGTYTTPTTLPDGSYIVKFQAPGSDGPCSLAIEYSGNAGTAAAATPVPVSAPTIVTGIDATLDYGGVIAGRITDAASDMPVYGTVQVYDATGALAVTGVTGMLGHFRTPAGLPRGSYRVQFVADGHVSLFYGGATALEAAAPVPSGASDIIMGLPRGGTLTGHVTAADTGAPLEHAAVTLYGAGGRVVATQLTAFDGSYRFAGSLPSALYRIGVAPGKRDDGTPYFTGYDAVFSGGARNLATAQPIVVTAPQTVAVDLAMPSTQNPPPTPTPTPLPGAPNVRTLYLPLTRR